MTKIKAAPRRQWTIAHIRHAAENANGRAKPRERDHGQRERRAAGAPARDVRGVLSLFPERAFRPRQSAHALRRTRARAAVRRYGRRDVEVAVGARRDRQRLWLRLRRPLYL